MRSYSDELKGLEEYFKKYGSLEKLNAAEELLYMYIGMINSQEGGFADALAQRAEVDENMLLLILNDYTLEVGSVVAALMQDISESMASANQEKISKDMDKISKDIALFLGEDSKEILKGVLEHYQEEFAFFEENQNFDEETETMMQTVKENFQLPFVESNKIDVMPQENYYALVGGILQEVFMLMGVVSMVEGDKDLISQEEYEEENFDIKKKMRESIEEVKNQKEIYERADFAYSTTEKVLCNICHNSFAKSGIQRHVGSCSKKYVESGEGEKSSFLLKIYDKYMPDYFLHVLVSQDARLGHLDTFLRDIWLECCGHMSAFRQGRDELDMGEYIECLTQSKKIEYTYDFGSSTDLIIEFKKEFQGDQEHLIKLVARNATIKAKCHSCEKKDAKYICTECMYGGDEVILCENCVRKHTKKYHDGEDYMISNFVNSPRTGICAYGALEEEL